MLAFQKAGGYNPVTDTPGDVIFIAGIHGDDGNGTPTCLDASTGWNDIGCITNTAKSTVPPGLTNGVNCVSLFPSIGTEKDNAKYIGTLIGTASNIRASINNRVNWSVHNSAVFDISPSAYMPNITCPTLSTNSFNLDNTINVSPNPTTGYITVSGLHKAEKYSIYNVLGKEVLKGEASENKPINVQSLTEGMYFLKLEDSKVIKFIKK